MPFRLACSVSRIYAKDSPMPRTKPVTAQPLLTVPEVAEQWHVNDITVYREIWRGQLRAVKVAGAWRIKASELERYLDERTS
jgi:excisionase family DNA binding protein